MKTNEELNEMTNELVDLYDELIGFVENYSEFSLVRRFTPPTSY